jgi:hypothetical protein
MRFTTACTTALLVAAVAAAGGADEVPAEVPKPDAEKAPPTVELDRLLRLPNSYEADVDRRSGATASEWRARFQQARQEVSDAKERLAKVEAELQETSQSTASWAVAAPGARDPEASPMNLRLREELRAQRSSIEASERRLRELEVEADLAAVPPDWRE